ncbi:MAG: ferredoxin [Clostridia bacterium]|nr:ferredoxin [Clostridia bacterium]
MVNEGCIGCGLCEGTCPEVFHMTDDGIAAATETEVLFVNPYRQMPNAELFKTFL